MQYWCCGDGSKERKGKSSRPEAPQRTDGQQRRSSRSNATQRCDNMMCCTRDDYFGIAAVDAMLLVAKVAAFDATAGNPVGPSRG